MTFSPKESDDVQELWLDLLCIESIIRIIWIKGFTPKVVYYCQISILVKPLLGIISLFSKTTFSQINDCVLSELRMEGVSLYELIHSRINLFLEETADEWCQRVDIRNVIYKQSYNADKVNAYLMAEALYLVYRPMELICLAQKLSRISPTVILTKNFFANRLSQECGQVSLNFYNIYFSQYFPFPNRLNFQSDKKISRKYFRGRLVSYMLIVIKWLIDFAVIITTTFLRLNRTALKDTHAINFGVEFYQRMFRPDENNELFWLPLSKIAGDTVYHLEMSELDEESQQNLSKYGVHRVRIGDIGTTLKRIVGKHRGNDAQVVVPGFKYLTQGLFGLVKLGKYFIGSAESTWLHIQLLKYYIGASYWQSIYHQYNIKILWSMFDGGVHQFTKSQAIENLGGFHSGSHWSNFPNYQIDSQKCYDVFFAWANYFFENIFTRYPYPAAFVSGYLSDHYFEKHRNSAIELRNQYSGKFIISYQDNNMGNDVLYSKNMQLNLHKMCIDILEENRQVVLFLKPKKRLIFDVIKSKIPELEDLIEQGRIVVFLGESSRKAVPAMVGMASDLVVGLGISTTAAESYFAGTLAFHADLTGMVNNGFGNRGLGQVVFRDLEPLKEAIQNCIDEGTTQRYQDAKEIYKMLDPFQDGMAFQRVGSVLKKLQESLLSGENREQALQSIKQ